jgi:hypothetical protein
VDGWISGGSVALTTADLDEISRAIESLHAGTGPSTPHLQAKAETL